ncbi:MAG: hypothetical protein II658_03370 [Prevotella sp.]|nr:hypothetical protein [Prevotella sp.]
MKKNVVFTFSILALIFIASCNDKSAMREQLDYVSQCNRADTVFTEKWLPTVDSLVRFFDRHGNANERMIAHYLKGRVHHDMGEAPIALECYQKATEMADTTKEDCDLYTLYAIYGQMALLFDSQYLPDDEMRVLKIAERISWKDKDTINAIYTYELRKKPYYLLKDTDEILNIERTTKELYREINNDSMAARTSRVVISIYLDRKQYEEAFSQMQYFESSSGLFDSLHNIKRGYELYYYDKGRYLLAIGQIDSAQLYFNKTLDRGLFEAGYKGLLSVYKAKHNSDSIAKYAELFANANDSNYFHVNQERVHQVSALYNYNRQQMLATQKSIEAERYRNSLYVLLCMAVLALAGLYLWVKRRKRKKAMEMNALKADLSKAIDEYNKLQRQYETLQNANRLSQMETDALERESRDALKSMEDYGRLLEEMELDLASKDAQIHAYEQRLASLLSGKSEEALQASAVVGRMRELAVPKKENPLPSEKDWSDLLKAVSETLPSFHKTIMNGQLSTQELRTCVLVRLSFTTNEISSLLDTSPQRIAKVKLIANDKLFSMQDARSLYKNLLSL